MLFKLDVARSNLYSATVKIDDSPIAISEGNEGFSRYSLRSVVQEGQLLGTAEVEGGENCRVQLLAAEGFDFSLAEEENPQVMIPGSGFVFAPVTEGAEAGFAYVLIDGNAVGKVPLVYGQTIEQQPEEEKSFLDKLFGK